MPHLPRERRAPGRGLWLITFTDILALMLAFFVMLFAMAEPPPEPVWDGARRSLAAGLAPWRGEGHLAGGPVDAPGMPTRPPAEPYLDMGYLGTLMSEKILMEPALADVRLERRPQGLTLSLPADLLFAPGSAALSERGQRKTAALAGALGRIKNRVALIGHTDPRPIEAARAGESVWPTNRALSLARALAVARVLRQAGCTAPIEAWGAGAGDYTPGEDEAARMAAARRVDIVILDEGKLLTK